jgi:photosystem II stability/assembly factor-like uncharacterized protein
MKQFLLRFLLACSSPFTFNAQLSWAPTNGPYGAACNRLNLINNEVYSATSCGIYSTNDNGVSWTSRNNGLDGCVDFQDIEIINNKLIAGTSIWGGNITYEKGIYISNDNGLNWTLSNTGLLDGSPFEDSHLSIRDIFINGNDILIGTQDGVFKSTNFGQSWAPSNIGINEPNNIQALQFVKFGSAIFLETANDIYRSVDNGFTWVDLNNNIGANPFSLVANSAGLFCTGSLGLYKSTNNGASWTLVNNNLPDLPTILHESNGVLYCGGQNMGMHISTNNGVSWNLIEGGYSDFLFVNNTHYMCNNNGVFSCNTNLSVVNSGLGGASSTNVLHVDGNDVYSGTSNGIYKTTDEGNTWKNMRSGLPFSTNVKCMTRSGSNLIIGTKNSGVYISNDNGNSWTSSSSGLTINGVNCFDISMLYTSNGKVYLGAKQNTTFNYYAALFVSNNNGQSWIPVTSGLGENYYISSMTSFGSYLIVGSFSNGAFLSTDNGNTWLYDGLNVGVRDLASDNNGYYAISGPSVFSTQNMGNSWGEVVLTSGSSYLTNIEKLNSLLVAQSSNNGLYYLNNGNWLTFESFGLIGGLGVNKTICQKQNGNIFIGQRAYTNANNGNITYVDNGVSKYIGNQLILNELVNDVKLEILPNPAGEYVVVKADENIIGKTFHLYNQLGSVINKGEIKSENTIINLQDLLPGVYYVKIINSSHSAEKLIKY